MTTSRTACATGQFRQGCVPMSRWGMFGLGFLSGLLAATVAAVVLNVAARLDDYDEMDDVARY